MKYTAGVNLKLPFLSNSGSWRSFRVSQPGMYPTITCAQEIVIRKHGRFADA